MVSVDKLSNASFIVPDEDNDFIDAETPTPTPSPTLRGFHKNR
jgi:hypothetical protein